MKISIDTALCKKCAKCCKGIPGNQMAIRETSRPNINKNGKCEFLSIHNICRNIKPFDCKLFPIFLLEDGVYIDKSCPAWSDALQQFHEYAGKLKKENIIFQGEYKKIWGE